MTPSTMSMLMTVMTVTTTSKMSRKTKRENDGVDRAPDSRCSARSTPYAGAMTSEAE